MKCLVESTKKQKVTKEAKLSFRDMRVPTDLPAALTLLSVKLW